MIFTDRVNGLPIFEADGLPDTVKPFEKVWLFTTADLFDTGERETTGFLYGESRLLNGHPPTFNPEADLLVTPFVFDGSKYVVDGTPV